MSRILLIGPPGAGKSTVGKALAKVLGIQFIDTDKLIEKETGKSITDIFVVDGEPHFRALELETLKSVLTLETGVISLGGGAPISDEAQRVIKNSNCGGGCRKVHVGVQLSPKSAEHVHGKTH